MADKSAPYVAYLLRVWRADNGGRPVWRFSLESREWRQVFASAEELLAFLKTATNDERPETDENE